MVLFGGAQLDDTWMLRLQGVAGQFAPFGQSCAANLTLTNRLGSVPRLGATFDAELRNIPATAQSALMALGASNQFIGNFPLPIGLDFLGFTGCWLYQDSLAIVPAILGSGIAIWSVSIPLSAELASTHVYIQGVIVVPGINPAGVTVSNGGDLLIGTDGAVGLRLHRGRRRDRRVNGPSPARHRRELR